MINEGRASAPHGAECLCSIIPGWCDKKSAPTDAQTIAAIREANPTQAARTLCASAPWHDDSAALSLEDVADRCIYHISRDCYSVAAGDLFELNLTDWQVFRATLRVLTSAQLAALAAAYWSHLDEQTDIRPRSVNAIINNWRLVCERDPWETQQ